MVDEKIETNEMSDEGPAILGTRRAQLFTFAFCVFEALPLSWILPHSSTWITESVSRTRDWLFIFFLIAAIIFLVSVAIRSPFLAERIVFGVATVGYSLWLVRWVLLPSTSIRSVIDEIESLLWGLNALLVLLLLLGVWKERPSRKTSV